MPPNRRERVDVGIPVASAAERSEMPAEASEPEITEARARDSASGVVVRSMWDTLRPKWDIDKPYPWRVVSHMRVFLVLLGTLIGMDPHERSALSEALTKTLRAERAAKGWTQDEMVERSGIPKTTYRRLEVGSRVADVTQIGRICRALGITFSDFSQRVERRLADDAREA